MTNPEDSPGAVRKTWTKFNDLVPCATVLFERAVYIVLPDNKNKWNSISERLSQGVIPDMPASRLIRLDAIDHVEIARAGATTIGVAWLADGQIQKFSTTFPSVEAREEFLGALEEYRGQRLSLTEMELSFLRATIVPWIVLAVLLLLVTGLAWLSAYWTAHPPPPPVGKVEQDWFVKGVVRIGPTQFLLFGAIAIAMCTGWLVSRIMHRPHVYLLKLLKGESRGA